MRYVPVLAALLALVGCASMPQPLATGGPPELIRVPVPTYVPIPSEMTQRCRWVDTAPPSEVFSVSAGRKTCLQRYEKQLQAVERVQGQPAP